MKRKALIIDDNSGDIELIKENFVEAGLEYQIFTAEDGEEGLVIAWQEHPDIVFLDINMPGLDGYDVCRQLKMSGTKKVHIVMMTGSHDPNIEHKAKRLGADDFCSKQSDDMYKVLMRYDNIVRQSK